MRMGGVLYWRILVRTSGWAVVRSLRRRPGMAVEKTRGRPWVLTEGCDVHIYLPVPACLSPQYMPTGHWLCTRRVWVALLGAVG